MTTEKDCCLSSSFCRTSRTDRKIAIRDMLQGRGRLSASYRLDGSRSRVHVRKSRQTESFASGSDIFSTTKSHAFPRQQVRSTCTYFHVSDQQGGNKRMNNTIKIVSQIQNERGESISSILHDFTLLY